MTEDTRLKNRVLQKIEQLSDDKLRKIDQLLNKLLKKEKRKDKIMSLAGSWSDMKEDDFHSLVEEVKERRKEANRYRLDE